MSDNTIDEELKKESENTSSFLNSLLKNVIYMIIYVFIGISILYGCKVAAGGLIPTDLNNGCNLKVVPEPIIDENGIQSGEKIYKTSVKCTAGKDVTTNINIVYKDDMYQSTKLEFSFKDNVENLINAGVIKWLMELTNGPKANNYTYYLGKIIQNIVFTNFSLFDKLYKMINNIATSPISESFVIFILPYLIPIIFPFFIFVNMGIFVFGWFYYLTLFWAEKEPKNQGEIPHTVKWQDGKTNWKYWLVLFIAFCFMFIPFALGSLIGIVMPIYTIIFPLFAKGHVKGTPTDQSYNFGDFFTDTLKFKKHVIMYFFSYYVVMGAYNSNGENGSAVALTAFLAIALIWFFDKMFGVFTPYKWTSKDNITPMMKSSSNPIIPPVQSSSGLSQQEQQNMNPSER